MAVVPPLPAGPVVLAALTDLVFAGALAVAAYTDLRRGRIPNELTFGAAGAGLLLSSLGQGIGGGLLSVEGWLLGGAFFIVFFLLGAMGAGDVKLLAAVGALKGPAFVFHAFLFTALAGGAIAVFVLLQRRGARYAFSGVALQWQSLVSCQHLFRPAVGAAPLRFPYGTAIGSLAALVLRV